MQAKDVPLGGLDRILGLTYEEVSPDRVSAVARIVPAMRDRSGHVHRSVFSALAESVGSVAGATWYGQRGDVVGVANRTSHLSGARDGDLTVVAEPVYRDDQRQLWRVSVRGKTSEGSDQLVAQVELDLANVPEIGLLGRS